MCIRDRHRGPAPPGGGGIEAQPVPVPYPRIARLHAQGQRHERRAVPARPAGMAPPAGPVSPDADGAAPIRPTPRVRATRRAGRQAPPSPRGEAQPLRHRGHGHALSVLQPTAAGHQHGPTRAAATAVFLPGSIEGDGKEAPGGGPARHTAPRRPRPPGPPGRAVTTRATSTRAPGRGGCTGPRRGRAGIIQPPAARRAPGPAPPPPHPPP